MNNKPLDNDLCDSCKFYELVGNWMQFFSSCTGNVDKQCVNPQRNINDKTKCYEKLVKSKPCPYCGNKNAKWIDDHTWICYNCVGKPDQSKPIEKSKNNENII